jgi:hypothetical protein
MSQIFEPYVESLIKTSNDTDRAGYSNHRLVVAAVLISDYGDSGIKLISNQKELLTMYRPSDKQYLHKDLDSSFFHIYAMLANSAVLVNKVDAVVGDGLTPNGLSFQNLFGAKTTVDYKGVIGVADNNKSYLLDGQDRLVDTYASVNVGPVSIQSLFYLSMVASLYNYDSVTKIGSVQVYGYKYNDDNDLILHLVYHYVDGVNEFIKTSLGLSSIPSSLPTAKSFTPDNNFNILAKSINPDGATITNSGSRDLRFMIINSSPNDEIINFKFNDQIGTDNLTLGFLTTNKTSQSVRLSPESSTLSVPIWSLNLKLIISSLGDEFIIINLKSLLPELVIVAPSGLIDLANILKLLSGVNDLAVGKLEGIELNPNEVFINSLTPST